MCEVRFARQLSLEVVSSIRLWKSIGKGVLCERVCVRYHSRRPFLGSIGAEVVRVGVLINALVRLIAVCDDYEGANRVL